MKKFLPYILILVMLVSFFVPFTADAQSISSCIPFGDSWFPDPERCAQGLILWVLFGILSFIALFLMLAGTLLDFVVNYTITEMALRLTGLTGINIAWKILKDLMNITFIFILVYEGIKMIIGLGSRESVKRFIIGIVLASVLINFSLFFTKVLIDASNIVTIGLYDTIINNSTAPVPNPTSPSVLGLSTPIMRAVGLTSFYSTETFDTMNANAGGFWSLMFLPILGIVLFLVVTFVFGAIAIMLIIRFLTLILLLVLSPVAYMGLALDFMKPYASQWWKAFNSQLIFPPVFMLMMLVVLTLVTSPGFTSVSGNWSDVTGVINTPPNQNPQASQGTIELIFKFAAIIGLIIASLTVSKSISKTGSSHIANATGKLNGLAGTAVMGGASRIGRNTIGRAGNAISNSSTLKDAEINGNVITRNLARYGRATGTKAATSSFDVRNTTGFESLSKQTDTNFGKGADAKKVNFQKDLENKAKKEADYAKSLKPTDSEKDRIKEQTGHTALETAEKTAKSNYENSVKAANEHIQRQKDAEGQIQNLKIKLDATKDEGERKKIEVEIKDLQQKIEVNRKMEKAQTDNHAELKSKIKDAEEKVKSSQKELDKIFSSRVEGYAKMFEEESKMVRYAKNAFRIPLTGTFVSKSDNIEIARKIRNQNKEKSNKEKLAELASKVAKEDEDTEEPKEEKPVETPKPETPTT